MSQGVLGFKYEEEKHDTGMTSLAGLPIYLDLLHAMGLPELIGAPSSGEATWLDGCADGIILDVSKLSGRGLCGGSGQGSEGRGVLQDTAPGGAAGDEAVGATWGYGEHFLGFFHDPLSPVLGSLSGIDS